MAGDDDLPSLDDWGPVDDDFWGSGSFLVPPPPPPPSLGSVCSSGAPFFCEMEGGPMGAHFDRAAFPSLPIIAVCSSVVLVAVLVASFLLWRHKSKVQNLLPCKNDQQGHLGELGAANGVTYEDVLINHHPTRLPPQTHIPGTQALMPLEILDVKLGEIGPPQITTLHGFYPGRDAGQGVKGPFHHHHPLYEEVSQTHPPKHHHHPGHYGSDFDDSGGGKLGGTTTSDDDFAEDEFSAEYPSREGSATSSVRGSTGGDLCRDPVSSSEDCDDDAIDATPFGYHGKQQQRHMDGHIRGNASYPLSEGGKTHSNDCLGRRSVPPPAPPPPANNAQWPTAANSSSQENIYSTIDEDELPDDAYPSAVVVHPSLTSLAAPSSTQRSPVVPKSVGSARDRPGIAPIISQRGDDVGSSYGDIMPAFSSSASFT